MRVKKVNQLNNKIKFYFRPSDIFSDGYSCMSSWRIRENTIDVLLEMR